MTTLGQSEITGTKNVDSFRDSVDAVLWDMDGTLINSEPYWLIAETALMARYGHAWTDEDQAHCLGGPLPKVGLHMAQLAKHAEAPEYFADELVRLVAEEFSKGLEFMPGARELVDELRAQEIQMALVSASPRILVDAAISLLPAGTFGCSVSSQDVSISKPDPMSYLQAARILGVDITRCIVIEDSRTGIASGLASGAVVLGIPSLFTYPAIPNLRLRKDLIGLLPEELLEIYQSAHHAPNRSGEVT